MISTSFFWSEWRDLNSRPLDPQGGDFFLIPNISFAYIFCYCSLGCLTFLNLPIQSLSFSNNTFLPILGHFQGHIFLFQFLHYSQ